MNHRYDDFSRREGRDPERERYRDDEQREDERSNREAQSTRSSFYPGDYGSQESGNWSRESQPYGQREPYNTSAAGGSSYGSSGLGPYRGEGSGSRGREGFGRTRWGGPPDYGYRGSSRYSESQYGQRRPSRDPAGRDFGGGGFRSRGDESGRRGYGSSGWESQGTYGDDYREGRYGSGDFGFEQGTRGEPSFGSSSGERYDSPRYFGSGSYAEGGTHYTGGWDQRGERSSSSTSSGDYGYGYQGSSAPGQRGESRHHERPGLLRRLFKRGPKGYQRSDERLREDISERLMESHDVDSSEVSVLVVSGKVTLDGTVPDRYMKHYIEDLVDACPGVQDIDNRIRVDANSGRWPEDTRSSSATGSSSGTSGQTGSGTSSTTTLGSSSSTPSSNGGRRRE
jgi:osmotically-inducible protein OsmY